MKKEIISFVYVVVSLVIIVLFIYEFISMDKFSLLSKFLFSSYISIQLGALLYETDPKKIFKKNR